MSKKEQDQESKTDLINSRIYQERLKMLRKAQEFSQNEDIPHAVECYGQYLNALASYYKVDEQKLSPNLFDQEKDLAELLLISHVYWDLAKAYDRSPRLQLESIRCLDQFVKFTQGYKYQYANARMLKNFIRKRLAHNPKAFKQTYDRIQVESKGCFIATDIFGSNSEITNHFRQFKFNYLTSNHTGKMLINSYYQVICPTYFFLRKSFFPIRPIAKLALMSTYRSLKAFRK